MDPVDGLQNAVLKSVGFEDKRKGSSNFVEETWVILLIIP